MSRFWGSLSNVEVVFVGLVFVVDVVVTHVEVDHPITRIRPDNGTITFMPTRLCNKKSKARS